jgi:hypothetical protein
MPMLIGISTRILWQGQLLATMCGRRLGIDSNIYTLLELAANLFI